MQLTGGLRGELCVQVDVCQVKVLYAQHIMHDNLQGVSRKTDNVF